jgi:4-amino-4-deoxy-L-arabinose transferase-like glycosyltransferase
MTATQGRKPPVWSWIGLGLILLFDVWLRGHTFAPSVKERIGFAPWPVIEGPTEPLDCDEAAYAYIGRRLAAGDVMYRDLTENKPPLGYWMYSWVVGLGGADELTIRLMPIPLILGTLALVWWIGLRLGGPIAALVAAGVCALATTDPYMYGNGSNLEHAINLFSVASLAAMVASMARPGKRYVFLAGLALGAAALVKQVAITHLLVYAIAILFWSDESRTSRLKRLLVLGGGFAAVWAVAAAVLTAQGAGWTAYDDIVRYGGALAAETPPEANAPPFFVRWITGNSDPRNGNLPWPFGKTDWLVWWGTGTWPIWVAAAPALLWLASSMRRLTKTNAQPSDQKEIDDSDRAVLSDRTVRRQRRLVVAWTLSAWIQVALPGLFWAHYYLLPLPGVALALGIAFADAIASRTIAGYVCASLLGVAVAGAGIIQTRDYLLVPAEQLTVRYKGGAQWVTLRDLGRELAHRTKTWRTRRLLVWGWQSPLFIYGEMDGVTRHFFVDPLLKSQAMAGRHPLIRPRLERIMADVERNRPELVLAGDPPFPALLEFLNRDYLRSRIVPRSEEGHGLWVRKDHFSEFESATSPQSNRRPRDRR